MSDFLNRQDFIQMAFEELLVVHHLTQEVHGFPFPAAVFLPNAFDYPMS